MSDISDYAAYAQPAVVNDETKARLKALLQEQLDLHAKVASLQAELERKQSELKTLEEFQIPELMDELGMKSFETEDMVVSLKEDIFGSIVKENEGDAFDWLRDQGQGGLIKRVVAVEFGRGEDEKAATLKDTLLADKYEPTDKTSVNFQTLSAYVRERLRDGKDVPEDFIKLSRRRYAKIKVITERD